MGPFENMFRSSSAGPAPGQRTAPMLGHFGQMENTVAGPAESDYMRMMQYMTQPKRDMGPDARRAIGGRPAAPSIHDAPAQQQQSNPLIQLLAQLGLTGAR